MGSASIQENPQIDPIISCVTRKGQRDRPSPLYASECPKMVQQWNCGKARADFGQLLFLSALMALMASFVGPFD